MSGKEARARKFDHFSSSIFSQSTTSEEWSRNFSSSESRSLAGSSLGSRFSERPLQIDVETKYREFTDKYGVPSRSPQYPTQTSAIDIIIKKEPPNSRKLTASQRKEQELSSHGVGGTKHYSIKPYARMDEKDHKQSFAWYDVRSEVSRVRPDASPADRKRAEQESSVFDSPFSSRPSSSMSVKTYKECDRTSLEVGESDFLTKERHKVIGKKLKPYLGDWRFASTEVKPATTKAYSVKEFKAKQLKSALDSHSYQTSTASKRSKDTTPVYEIDAKQMKQYNLSRLDEPQIALDVSVVTLEVSGLGADCTNEQLKGLCRGFHLVKVETEFDRITGKCSGKAVVQARVFGDQGAKNLNSKLVSGGLKTKEVVKQNGLKANYFDCKGRSFLDPTNEVASHRLTSKYASSNSEAPPAPTKTNAKPISSSSKSLQQWEKTRQTPSRSTSVKRLRAA